MKKYPFISDTELHIKLRNNRGDLSGIWTIFLLGLLLYDNQPFYEFTRKYWKTFSVSAFL